MSFDDDVFYVAHTRAFTCPGSFCRWQASFPGTHKCQKCGEWFTTGELDFLEAEMIVRQDDLESRDYLEG